MKKGSNKLISVIVILSILTSVFCINVFADESSGPPYLDTYAAFYFHELNTNFGRNSEGSCGYVAAGMLLSFYDSFLNDSFISENYDADGIFNTSTLDVQNSPGIKRETGTYTDYNNYIDNNADEYFHLKLLQIGRDDLGLCDPTLKEWIDFIFQNIPPQIDWLISINDIKDIIEEYLSQLPNDEESQKIKNNVSVGVSAARDVNHMFLSDPDTTIRAEMIEKIKAGIPVIYFGYSETTDAGHFMIAHDYNEANDEIYFHTGWLNNTSMTDKQTSAFIYNSNTAILWLEIDEDNLSYSHPQNYSDSVSDPENYYCTCQMFANHPLHTDNHVFIDSYDQNYHYSECHCGKKTTCYHHSLTYSNQTTSSHYESCRNCEYDAYQNHKYTIITSYTSAGHTLKCACGELRASTEAHRYSRYVSQNQYHHYVYCVCGYEIGSDTHSFIPGFKLGTSVCRECGYEKDSTGVSIVIKSNPDNPSEETQ